MQRPRGELFTDGEHATLVFQRVYRHAPELVWEAISTPEGLKEWLLCSHAEIEPRMGGRIELVTGAARYHSTGRILAWNPPKLLAYEWNVAPAPEMPRGERAVFRYELTPAGEVTHLLVTYERITRETARGFLRGTHAFLDRLEAQLDRTPAPDWLARFAELRAVYPEWAHHE